MAVRHRLFLFCAGFSSIASLLLYFYGALGLRHSVLLVLLPCLILLCAWFLWMRIFHAALARQLADFVRAAIFATFIYDVVRLPAALNGIPVFKAISYFGTIIAASEHPSALSELLGWSYHLSNGIGFGIMYAALFAAPRLWSAVAWGLLLEGFMLLTPYAEVFGYKLSGQFYLLSIGGHVSYGLGLWCGLVYLAHGRPHSQSLAALRSGTVPVALAGLFLIAAQFHSQHAASIPASPPPRLGEHLYCSWNQPEVDRIAALWVISRFIDRQADFYFIAPFSHFKLCKAVDLPEAEVRRSGDRAAVELLLAQSNLESDPRLALLARTAHLFEISPWQLPSEPALNTLGLEIVAADPACKTVLTGECLVESFKRLDHWYATSPSMSDPPR